MQKQQNLGRVPVKCFKAPSGLAYSSFKGGGSVVVGPLFNSALIVYGDSVFGLCFIMRYFVFYLVI